MARDKQMKISLEIHTLYNKYGPSVIKLLTSMISNIDLGPNRLPMKNNFTHLEKSNIKKVLVENGYLDER